MTSAWADGVGASVLVTAALAAVQTLLALRVFRFASQSPNRLVAELRLAQFAALVLAATTGAFVGLAAAHPAGGPDVWLSLIFLTVAATATLRDPREALTLLAIAFAAHAAVDVLHRPGWLPEDLAPRQFLFMVALHHALAGVLCYLPLLRR